MVRRQKEILKKIVEEYIRTFQPVSSERVKELLDFKLSSATIRNEMSKMEKQDILFKPHISSGRIPTINSFRIYINNLDWKTKEIEKKDKVALKLIFSKYKDNPKQCLKNLSKEISKLTKALIFLGFSVNDIYITGLSQLAQQPEFKDYQFFNVVSQVIDEIDNLISQLLSSPKDFQIILGLSFPSTDLLSVISIKLNQQRSILGLIGPLRMDYKRNIGIMNNLKEQIEQKLN